MDALVERLEARLHEWKPELADRVLRCITEMIELAGHDPLYPMRPRATEQEVLGLLDCSGPPPPNFR